MTGNDNGQERRVVIELTEEELALAQNIARDITALVAGLPCRAVVVVQGMALALAAYSIELEDDPNVGATIAAGVMQATLRNLVRGVGDAKPHGTA